MAYQHALGTVRFRKPNRYLAHTVELIKHWRERARTRNQLLKLEDHILQDIGLTQEQCAAEAAKSFWQS